MKHEWGGEQDQSLEQQIGLYRGCCLYAVKDHSPDDSSGGVGQRKKGHGGDTDLHRVASCLKKFFKIGIDGKTGSQTNKHRRIKQAETRMGKQFRDFYGDRFGKNTLLWKAHVHSRDNNDAHETQAERKKSLEWGAAHGHQPSAHLADQGGTAAKPGDCDTGDQSFVLRKPANTDGNRDDIGHSGPYATENSYAKDGKEKIAAAETGEKPSAAKK